MLISEKQQAANRENAKQSTGPKTDEGKLRSSLNAIKFGMRARYTLLPHEDPAEYAQLYQELESEWQPQTPTERFQVEQMFVAQWILGRLASIDNQILMAELGFTQQFGFVRDLAGLRRGWERSYFTALHEMERLRKEKRPRPEALVEAKPAEPPVHKAPVYVMSEPSAGVPLSTAPADSR